MIIIIILGIRIRIIIGLVIRIRIIIIIIVKIDNKIWWLGESLKINGKTHLKYRI